MDHVPGTKIEKPEAVPNDGNAMSIIAACNKALRRAGVPKEVIVKYQTEARSGDYDNLVQVSMTYCELQVG